MEQYLVRKRPFEEHAAAAAAPPPRSIKKGRVQATQPPQQQHHPSPHKPAAAAASSSFAKAASAGVSSLSFSKSGSSGSSGGSGNLKQMSITQMAKVTSVDEVASIHGFLQSAFDRSDWRTVEQLLRQLEGMFISKLVLQKTNLGKTLTNIKNTLKRMEQEAAATTTPAATAAAAAAAAATSLEEDGEEPEEAEEEIDEEERCRRADAIDLTDSAPPSSSAPASSSAAAAAAATSSSAASSSSASSGRVSAPVAPSGALTPLQLSVRNLSLSLLLTWHAQVNKEIAAESASGASGGPALEFNMHSNLKNRVTIYKALYYMLTDKDPPESAMQKSKRIKDCKPLIAKDEAAAAVASEVEQMLFRGHRTRYQEQLRARSNSELLSSTPTNKEEELTINQEPPAYASHARNLLLTLRQQPHRVQQLKQWVGREALELEEQSRRHACFEQIIAACKTFSV